jgi:NAD(P)-dependent dehydrogenase (short-subunit alcohol dehydrogenase family)
MMGFMDTPMAVTGSAQATGRTTDAVRTERNAMVPLRRRMGTGFGTAYAALCLASGEAPFVTGKVLRVDGGMGLAPSSSGWSRPGFLRYWKARTLGRREE